MFLLTFEQKTGFYKIVKGNMPHWNMYSMFGK